MVCLMNDPVMDKNVLGYFMDIGVSQENDKDIFIKCDWCSRLLALHPWDQDVLNGEGEKVKSLFVNWEN